MSFPADIVVFDKEGVPAVLVEVKSKVGTTPDWAAALRRNLAAHGLLPWTRFFVIATPDQVYLWVDKTAEEQQIAPDFAFDPAVALAPYYEQAGLAPDELSGSSLELLIASWLGELTHGPGGGRVPREAAAWLARSGFLDAIRGGRVEHD